MPEKPLVEILGNIFAVGVVVLFAVCLLFVGYNLMIQSLWHEIPYDKIAQTYGTSDEARETGIRAYHQELRGKMLSSLGWWTLVEAIVLLSMFSLAVAMIKQRQGQQLSTSSLQLQPRAQLMKTVDGHCRCGGEVESREEQVTDPFGSGLPYKAYVVEKCRQCGRTHQTETYRAANLKSERIAQDLARLRRALN